MKPTTPHDPLDDLIAAALHGDLTPEERTQFESRLSTDPAAQAAYEEAKAMHDLLDQTHRTAQPDPDFEQRMVSGVRRKLAHQPHEETALESLLFFWNGVKWLLKSRWKYAVAGVALLMLAAFGVIYTHDTRALAGMEASGISDPSPIDRRLYLPMSVYANLLPHAAKREMMLKTQLQAQIDDLKVTMPRPMTRIERPFGATHALAGNDGSFSDGATTVATNIPMPSGPASRESRIDYGIPVPADVTTGTAPSSGYAEPDVTTTPQGGTTRGLAFAAAKPMLHMRQMDTDNENAQKVSSVDSSAVASSAPSMTTAINAAPPVPTQSAAMQIPATTITAPTASPSFAITAPDRAPASASSPGTAWDQNWAKKRMALEDAQDKVVSKDWNPAIPANAPAAQSTPPAPEDSRKLIRNAQLDLEVKSYQNAVDQITALTKTAGGYVDTSNSQRGGNGKLQGAVVVKILPQNLDDFLLKLRDVGEVQNQSVSTEDVTKEYIDTQARLVNSQKMEQQLQELLKRENGKVSDLLAVERELGRVRGEIEQMQGQLKLYDFQVAYATVTMNIAEKDLNQAAAYLLKEQDDFALFATDVEATFQKARTAADDFKTQVLVANLQHNSGTDVSAELTVMVAPDQTEKFLSTIRGLGRVANFTRQTQRVAKDGGDSSQPADETRTDKDKVQVHVTIHSDDDSRKQVALVVVAKQVDDALDQAKVAALASTGVEILSSSLNTNAQGASTAQLSVRVPGKEYTTLMDAFRALGRRASLTVQRNDQSGPGASGDDVPVIVSLSLTDEEVPVQTTNLVLVTPNVDDQSQQIKRDSAAAGVTVKASSFEGQPNGSHVARLTLLLPIGKYPAYLETLKKLGRVQSLSVQRSDSTGTATDDAPVAIALALTDDDPPVQVTQMVVVASDVDAQSQQIKKDAAAAGAQVKASNFQRDPDGTERADLTLRLPMGKYAAYVADLTKAGKVESLSVQREDRPDLPAIDDTAPVEIGLQLHNARAIVPDNGGLWPTLRDTFGEGFAALFGSVKTIGVLIAFVAPWAITGIFFAWVGRRIYVWRKNR